MKRLRMHNCHSPVPFAGRGRGGFFLLSSVLCILLVAVTGMARAQGLIVMGEKVSGELPLDPSSSLWRSASALEVPVAPQVMARPRIYDSSVKKISVRALHNSKDIAFLIEWQDKSSDTIIDLDKFPDAVALEFPASVAKGKPHFAMGDNENPVNIWYWKSIWQIPEGQTVPSETAVRAKEYAPHFRTDEKTHVFVDDFLTGALAGNPVSLSGRSPVENITAQGFGSATDNEKEGNPNLNGFGKWQAEKWAVVFKRALNSQNKYDVIFREGGVTPVAFAVWNGSEMQAGGRKAASTWYYVGLETEEKKTIYIYPIVAFIVSAGILAGIVLLIRKKKEG